MADGSKVGLAAAIGMLGAGEMGAEVEQDELFADADDAASSLTPAASLGRGRPKGSRNRSTEEWRRFLLTRYQSPIVGLAETWSRSADALARELGLTKIKAHLAPGEEPIETYRDGDGRVTGYLTWDRLAAFNVQQAARIAALPYLHQKQPQAIELPPDTGRGMLVINLGGGGNTSSDGLSLPLADSEENQQLIDVTPNKSDDDKSDDQGK